MSASAADVAEPKFQLVISQEELNVRIREHAANIAQFCRKRRLQKVCLVVNLNGAVPYAKCLEYELLRQCVEVSWTEIRIQSYAGTVSGQLRVAKRPRLRVRIEDELVLIVDEIFDQGRALTRSFQEVRQLSPMHLGCSIIVLRRASDCTHAIIGNPQMPPFSIIAQQNGIAVPLMTRPFEFTGKEFLVGFGLDYQDKYREKTGIYSMHFS